MNDERPRTTKAAERRRGTEPGRTGETRPDTAVPAIPPPRPIPPLPARLGSAGQRDGGNGPTQGETAPTPGTVSPTGTGQDARHRGWYWHWNTLITQYAPILGLKGVGLLNSYTVWTDRREGSPHQGFAFPAQESEARFYGEGREELITLNKVLVALDLIEIHKEMVVRQDDRGRRWRVPHNFYRVKDPKDGLVLSLPAVVRVLELAQRDRNVFRQVRHIFGPQFAPIDRTSLWHSLLPELRALPLWAELEARATRERRAPRASTPARAATSPPVTDASAPPAAAATIVISDDIAPLSGTSALDNETVQGSTIGGIADFDRSPRGIARPGDDAFALRPPPRRPADNALPPTLVTRPVAEPSHPTIGSISDEGMMNVEDGRHRSVARADSMYYQSGETKEEMTSTSSTSSRAGAGADAGAHTDAGTRVRETQRDAAYRPTDRTLSPPPPPARPSVSDLFAALEAQRRYEPPDDTALQEPPGPPDMPDAPDQRINALTVAAQPTSQAPAHSDVSPAVSFGQPLPPEPGEPEEGLIVVRAVAVTDAPAVGTEERALLAEIESALTMTNGRPPSDMEMSLYWQIARDCDPAARSQPGPGSGLGWVLAAITEAVYSSGTGRVAPKYVARICERWTADGYMSDGRIAPVSDIPAPPPQWPLTPPISPVALGEATAPREVAPAALAPPAVETPLTEAELARLWPAVVRRLEGILPTDSLRARWFTEARVLSVAGERAIVQATDAETALKLTNYRGLISRRLSDVLGRPVEAVFQAAPPTPPDPDASVPQSEAITTTDTPDIPPEVPASPTQTSTRVHSIAPSTDPETSVAPAPSPWSWPASGGTSPAHLPAEIAPRATMGSGPIPVVPPLAQGTATPAASPSAKRTRVVSREQPLEATPASSAPASTSLSIRSSHVPTFTVTGSDETNHDLWPRVLAHLRDGMTDVTFKVWMEPTALIATDADGTLVIGGRNRVQRERLERQHAAEIAAALSALLGRPVRVRIAVIGE